MELVFIAFYFIIKAPLDFIDSAERPCTDFEEFLILFIELALLALTPSRITLDLARFAETAYL